MAGKRIGQDSDDIIADINIIPLVDISLVLLIIFMVTANFIITSTLKVDLPSAAQSKSQDEPSSLTITISREGPVALDNEIVTNRELKEKLRQKISDDSSLSIVLNVDKAVNFKNVVAVLDNLNELGITKVNIAAAGE